MSKFVENFEDVLSKINMLKDLGYTEIRSPGGTDLSGSYYSGVFICSYDKVSKQFFFLGIGYDPTFFKRNERDVHTKSREEDPRKTGYREIFEETGLIVNEDDLDLVWSYQIPDRRNTSKMHTRYFYFTEKYSGNLHSFEIERANPISAETSKPLWIPAKIFKQVLFKGHQEAFRYVIERLKGVSAEYYYALENI
jgi:hypothetical protein